MYSNDKFNYSFAICMKGVPENKCVQCHAVAQSYTIKEMSSFERMRVFEGATQADSWARAQRVTLMDRVFGMKPDPKLSNV
jgi:hypothetical protein